MGSAPSLPDQTPIVLVKAGMVVVFDHACRQALMSCGVDPDKFGTYNDRKNAEKKARDKLGKSYSSAASLEKAKQGKGKTSGDSGPVGTWTEANSQSGHVMQNAFAQGKRNDPCSNVKPEGKDGGAYGYDMGQALCMDHFGKSTVIGSPHYEITQGEADFARNLPPGSRVDTATMQKSVENTAAIAVSGSEARMGQPDTGALTAKRKAEALKFKEAQDAHAKELKAGDDKAKPDLSGPGSPGFASGAKGKGAKGAGGGQALSKNEQKAVECIVAAWKASLDQIRKDAIENNSSAAGQVKKEVDAHNKKADAHNNAGKKPKMKRAESYDDLPPDAQGRVDKAVNDRQDALEGKKKPTKDDCREYQANWLWQQERDKGELPPMAGRVPGERQGGQKADDGKKRQSV